MKSTIICFLVLCLLLSGCSILDGSYHSAKPHEEQTSQTPTGNITAYDYQGLYNALRNLAESGTVSGVIRIPRYDQSVINSDLNRAIGELKRNSPIAAYAVESIRCEVGTSGGQNAVSVNITYIHDQSQIRKIRRVADMQAAREAIAEEMDNCAASVVLYVTR